MISSPAPAPQPLHHHSHSREPLDARGEIEAGVVLLHRPLSLLLVLTIRGLRSVYPPTHFFKNGGPEARGVRKNETQVASGNREKFLGSANPVSRVLLALSSSPIPRLACLFSFRVLLGNLRRSYRH